MGELIMFPGCSSAVEIQGRGTKRVLKSSETGVFMSGDEFRKRVAKAIFESRNRGGFDEGKKTWDVRGIDGRSVLGRGGVR